MENINIENNEEILTDSVESEESDSCEEYDSGECEEEDSIEKFIKSNTNVGIIDNCIKCSTNKQMKASKYCVMCIGYECNLCGNPTEETSDKICKKCFDRYSMVISNMILAVRLMGHNYLFKMNRIQVINCVLEYMKIVDITDNTLVEQFTILKDCNYVIDQNIINNIGGVLFKSNLINNNHKLSKLIIDCVRTIIYGEFFEQYKNNEFVNIIASPFEKESKLWHSIIDEHHVPEIKNVTNNHSRGITYEHHIPKNFTNNHSYGIFSEEYPLYSNNNIRNSMNTLDNDCSSDEDDYYIGRDI